MNIFNKLFNVKSIEEPMHDVKAIDIKIEELRVILKDTMSYYSSHGCQCSFPRYRQMVSIDCSGSGKSFFVPETEGLITESRKYFDTEDIEPFPEVTKQIWTCKTCKSTYEFGWCDFSIMVDRSYLKIKNLNAIDIGAQPLNPIAAYVGPIGHSVPHGMFTFTLPEQLLQYLQA